MVNKLIKHDNTRPITLFPKLYFFFSKTSLKIESEIDFRSMEIKLGLIIWIKLGNQVSFIFDLRVFYYLSTIEVCTFSGALF